MKDSVPLPYGDTTNHTAERSDEARVRVAFLISLRTKLVIIFVGVTLVSLSLLSVINNNLTRIQVLNDVGASTKNVARTQALISGSSLEQQVHQLKAFGLSLENYLADANQDYAGLPPEIIREKLIQLERQWQAARAANNDTAPLLRARLQNTLVSELNEYRRTYLDTVDLLVTDARGGVAATTYRTSSYWQENESWWAAAYQAGRGAITIGQPETDQRTSTLYVPIAIPLYRHNDAALLGILRATYRLKPLSEALSATKVGQTGRLELYFPNGYELARLAPLAASELNLVPAHLNATIVSQLQAPDVSHLELTYDTVPSLVSAAPIASVTDAPFIRNLQWTVLVHQTQSESLDVIKEQTNNTLWFALVVAGGVSLIAFWLARVLTNPITRLTLAAEQISTGDLNARAQIETRDEVGTLAFAFNKMANQLQHALANLEQRVTERTAALAKSNQALENENAERRRVEATLRQQTDYLSALNEISLSLIGRLDSARRELLHDILRRAGDMLGAPHGYIYLLASDGVAEHPLSSSKPFFKGSEGKGTDAEMQMRVGTGAQAEFVGNRIQRGMGLAGQVWESGQPLVVNDYQNWPSRLGATQAATLRAVVGVPLIAREQVIGVLGLAHTVKGQTFSEAEVEVLRRFAPLAAIAIENARLFAETQTTLDETAKLYEASRRLASADNLQEVIAAVVESVPNAALNRAVIMMVERDASDEITGGEIIANWYSGHGNAPAPIGTCYPGEAFRVAQVLLSKEPVFLNDLLNDARINPFAAQIFSQQKVRALAVLPLWFSGRPFGMLILQAEQPQAFAPEVIRPYLSLTQQMAVSIENLRLIEQTRHSLAQAQQLAQREQIVSDVAERLHKAADVRRIMRLAAQEAQRVTGSPRVVVRLAPARKANEQSP